MGSRYVDPVAYQLSLIKSSSKHDCSLIRWFSRIMDDAKPLFEAVGVEIQLRVRTHDDCFLELSCEQFMAMVQEENFAASVRYAMFDVYKFQLVHLFTTHMKGCKFHDYGWSETKRIRNMIQSGQDDALKQYVIEQLCPDNPWLDNVLINSGYVKKVTFMASYYSLPTEDEKSATFDDTHVQKCYIKLPRFVAHELPSETQKLWEEMICTEGANCKNVMAGMMKDGFMQDAHIPVAPHSLYIWRKSRDEKDDMPDFETSIPGYAWGLLLTNAQIQLLGGHDLLHETGVFSKIETLGNGNAFLKLSNSIEATTTQQLTRVKDLFHPYMKQIFLYPSATRAILLRMPLKESDVEIERFDDGRAGFRVTE